MDNIKKIQIDHLKDEQKAEILALYMKYTLMNAVEGTVEILEPVVAKINEALTPFFDAVQLVIKESENGSTDKPAK